MTTEWVIVDVEDIHEMALCEQEKLILRQGRLYRFTPITGCRRCEELADMYEDE